MTPDVHGLWVQPGDITGMCDRLVQLARSDELRSSLAHAARLHVIRNNSAEAVLQQLTRLYDDLIHKTPHS
jgi:glycosyltransferase involved in cell wall biosynthesis